MTSHIAAQLNWLLRPIQPLLDDPRVTDLHINGPNPDGETTNVFIKRGAVRSMETVRLRLRDLENIGDNAAALMRQDISEDRPFCSTKLPQGQRVQLVRAPALPTGRYAIAIRRPSQQAPSVQNLVDYGLFSQVRTSEIVRSVPRSVVQEVLEHKAGQRWPQMISAAIHGGLNVVWCGKVGSGKTTNMRAFLDAVPLHTRIVTVEDTEEIINLPHQNVVNMLYPAEAGSSISTHTAETCIKAALRLDMDMLLNQEIRDGAAFAYLRALASGHPGMTSCHAESAEGAFDAIALMVRQNEHGKTMDTADLHALLRSLIHLVVYCEDVDGKKRVTQIYFEPKMHVRMPKSAVDILLADEDRNDIAFAAE